MMRSVRLKKNAEIRLKRGHLWVFSNELQEMPDYEPGEEVEVIDYRGKNFGTGFFNPGSLISVRLLLTNGHADADFFTGRIEEAKQTREFFFPDEPNYRLVFGESDFLPGLIIDKYGDYFAVQINSYGMDIRKKIICDALIALYPDTRGIIGKNRNRLRDLEGLPQCEEILFGEIPDEIITSECGVKLSISLSSGQKTGYFLDQRLNRLFLRSISRGRNILDLYCNQGGFALNSAIGGAKSVTAVDVSSEAIGRAMKNAELNNINNIEFATADTVDYLGEAIAQGQKFDIIVLDPPAFAKNKKSLPTAKAGYAKINRMALQALNERGFLVSSSCSMHMDEDTFRDLIVHEAGKIGKRLRLVQRGVQPPDHPSLMQMPETTYLKFFVFQVF